MSLNRKKYQALANLLEELRLYASSTQLEAVELRQRLASLQQMFKQQIVPLADVGEASPQGEDSRVLSYRTEISKQLRLLEIDVMFFQGARQASTTKTRLETIGDRLTTLIGYCDAILQQEEKEEK